MAGQGLTVSFPGQDTGLYYHRYLQEVINVLETDSHFREKLQAANAEDIKVRARTWGLSSLGGTLALIQPQGRERGHWLLAYGGKKG